MSLDEEMRALREGTALARMTHVVGLRLSGEDAFDTVDAVVPRKLFLRDGQAFQTVLLDEGARVIADVCVIHDDEDFIMLAEGIAIDQLVAHVLHYAAGPALSLSPIAETHEHISLHGPFAWELLAELAGGRPIGVPYMTFFRTDDFFCLRSGKTGEFGYDLLVPSERAESVMRLCDERGRAFELRSVGRDALDECALENCFFNIRREGQAAATIPELQLQWAVSSSKPAFVGRDALLRSKAAGLRRRLTHVVAGGPVRVGDVVSHQGDPVGVVINASLRSRPETGALALLDLQVAHPGIDALAISHDGASVAARTLCAPHVSNLSLRVNPQRHTFAGRAQLMRV